MVVLGKEPSGEWLHVEAPDKEIGWMKAENLEVLADLSNINLEVTPTPPPTITPESPVNRPPGGGSGEGQTQPTAAPP